ncbi:hypothetical protein ACFYXF_47475 [Streptomyces sp. NPDC002680]|uniref:hypothetical protein n=1 Tax=Streptomyces sp. NPDC002680 TaxID=3364659 RepID=UPI00369FF3E8
MARTVLRHWHLLRRTADYDKFLFLHNGTFRPGDRIGMEDVGVDAVRPSPRMSRAKAAKGQGKQHRPSWTT